MKNLLFIILMVFMAVSCGNRNTQNASQDEGFVVESSAESVEPEVKSTNDWDSALDEYEKYVDTYLKFYKKAMSGDPTAMTEYADYLQKAQKLTEKFSAVENDLSPKQYSRFMELQTKMVTGLAE